MQFEWDDNKNNVNIQKHGIDFLTAIAIFDDPNRLEEDCTECEYREIRTKSIGRVGDSILILTVIYTDRGENTRIISARKATKKERKYYGDFY